MTFELIAKNISDYIFLLRILSIAKYYHQTGFYNKMNFYSNDILSVHVMIKIDKKVFNDGLIYVDCEDGSIEFSTTGKRNPETDAYFPLKLPFEYVSILPSPPFLLSPHLFLFDSLMVRF